MIPLKHLRIFLFFPLFLFAEADYQVWFEGQSNLPITKKVEFEWRYAYRVDRNATRYHFMYQQVKFIFDLGKSWAIAPGYRQVYRIEVIEKEREEWAPGFEPILDFLNGGEVRGFEWNYRNRFQYVYFGRAWNNRNRLLIKFPKWGCSPLRLVLYEEIFYRLFEEIDQYRHYIGCELEVRKGFEGRIGYLLRYTRNNSSWSQQNVLFLELYNSY